MKTKREGISLIVLVITIIIMIVLAAAIILSLSNSGIIGSAREAVKSSDLATIKNAKAIIDSEIDIAKSKGNELIPAGKTYNEYVSERLEKEVVNVEEYYFYEKGIVVIPKGFVVSEAAGETSVEEGLVI